ncbi:DUF4304 domain-containing protein [Pseudomonas sp. BT-42-2]|uniref:DUF4304 domain-containing protein n=1 Tax=Pseudomonas sp. BT-42-2 TaxID=2986927 RepID=UPI0021F6AF54|nr:DUF4304 domain-containing protein [Pseudomonas sp. BT-42-2]MCV9917663.1 DUF4304 domain-containing protein [Pseudomonas sp. BT-42-2]
MQPHAVQRNGADIYADFPKLKLEAHITKRLTTNTIFDSIALHLGFHGDGATRFIEETGYYLLINYQKSVYNNTFYINIGIIYKELLSTPLSALDLNGAFKVKNPTTVVHVDFRLDDLPGASQNLQETLDSLIKQNDLKRITHVLTENLIKPLSFMHKNHARSTIKSLRDQKKLNAMILKEV